MQAFAAAGAACEVARTTGPGHAGELARARGGADAVFVLGGDGTVMEVLGALAGTGQPVGILPAGTGNLLARALGIPLDVRRAARALVAGRPRAIDLGRLSDGRRFGFALGLGLDVDMVLRAPEGLKRRLGIAAYVVSSIRAVWRNERFLLRATVDGQAVERECSMVMLANFGAVFNGVLTLGPGIAPDDGHLDLCVYSPDSFLDAAAIGWRLWRGDFRPHPRMLFRRGRRIRIESVPPREFEVDGDVVGVTPVEVDVEPKSGLVLVPAGN